MNEHSHSLTGRYTHSHTISYLYITHTWYTGKHKLIHIHYHMHTLSHTHAHSCTHTGMHVFCTDKTLPPLELSNLGWTLACCRPSFVSNVPSSPRVPWLLLAQPFLSWHLLRARHCSRHRVERGDKNTTPQGMQPFLPCWMGSEMQRGPRGHTSKIHTRLPLGLGFQLQCHLPLL